MNLKACSLPACSLNTENKSESSSGLERPAGISRNSRVSRFQLPVARWGTEMKQTTKYANHTKGPTAWFLSLSECSGCSVVFQAYPSLVKVNQAMAP